MIHSAPIGCFVCRYCFRRFFCFVFPHFLSLRFFLLSSTIKQAFNSLQVKFMPEALKPPMDCLAGFLKGGEIFKGGSIES